MTSMKNTKRALVSSIIALVLCFTMLLGTTYAWFTDEVSSSNNKIEAGTLKIDLLVRDDDGNYNSVKESQNPIFNYDLWEPGYTAVANVKVSNAGTLALQYGMQIVTNGLVEDLRDGNIMLSDVIDVYYAAKEVILDTRDAFDGAVEDKELNYIGTLTDVIFGGTMVKDTLKAEESDYATIVLKMKETAGNEYQDLSVGSTFDIKIFATQLAYESDSFNNQYDVIELPAATMMVIEPELLEMYSLDAGCVFIAAEDTWTEDTKYAYYFADFVAVVKNSDDVTLWGMYGEYGEQEFAASLEGGVDTRIIPLADAALSYDMGNISYQQLLEDVKTFACGVKGLDAGNTITITLRLYETSLTKENANGSYSYEETGVYYDVATYTYTMTP